MRISSLTLGVIIGLGSSLAFGNQSAQIKLQKVTQSASLQTNVEIKISGGASAPILDWPLGNSGKVEASLVSLDSHIFVSTDALYSYARSTYCATFVPYTFLISDQNNGQSFSFNRSGDGAVMAQQIEVLFLDESGNYVTSLFACS